MPASAGRAAAPAVAAVWRCALDQHWNYPYPASEGRPDLEPHVVIALVKSPATCIIRKRRPLRSDQDRHDATRLDGVADDLREIQKDGGRITQMFLPLS